MSTKVYSTLTWRGPQQLTMESKRTTLYQRILLNYYLMWFWDPYSLPTKYILNPFLGHWEAHHFWRRIATSFNLPISMIKTKLNKTQIQPSNAFIFGNSHLTFSIPSKAQMSPSHSLFLLPSEPHMAKISHSSST